MVEPSARDDGRVEQLLLPVLMVAFGAAAGATVAARPVELAVAEPPMELDLPSAAPVVGPAGYVRLEVADVVLTDGAAQSAVLLTGPGDGLVLPLFVAAEAGRTLQGRLSSASDTVPALARLIADTGGRVLRVELAEGTDEVVGRIVIARDGEEQPLETGLDEALAVAVSNGTHVWVARELVEARGFHTAGLTPREGELPSHLRPPAHL